MSLPQSVNRAGAAQIDLELPLGNASAAPRPLTIQRGVGKTAPTSAAMPESMKEPHRSGAVSRAGQHRWPQATMVVMGGDERQVYDSELLTVSTRGESLKNAPDSRTKRAREEGTEAAAAGKPLFPDIVGRAKQQPVAGVGAVVKSKQEARKARLATGSPSRNLTSLPKFVQGVSNSEERKEGEERKVVRNIKFWRGTTPVTRQLPRDKRLEKDETEADPDEVFITQQSISQLQEQEEYYSSWHENLTSPSEASRHQYYSWHMALRERLLKHEKMRYHEAVSRISKYRQRLRQRPAVPANHGGQEVQVWKNLLQRHEESKKRAVVSSNSQPLGIRMSPTKEWKPHVLGDDTTQVKPPFFGKPAALANDIAKKQFGKQPGATLPPSLTPHHKPAVQPEQENTTQNYPIHGEGLLKNEIRALSALRNAEKSAAERDSKQGSPSESDTKAETRALLIDLKQQLKAPKESADLDRSAKQKAKSAKKSAKRGQTAPHRARTDLGAKLNLLLQNSGQQSRVQSRSDGRGGESRQRSTRSRMRSQPSRQSGYRPLTRPRTYGEGNLPKIHNIIASTLWKRNGERGEDGDDDEEGATVKHRLTLNGIASREPFTSGVIAIAKKHISSRGGGGKEADDEAEKPLKDNVETLPPAKQTPLISQLRIASKNAGEEDGGKAEGHSYASTKKRSAAQRLYTPATVAQPKVTATSASLSKAFHKSLRENPQHMSLKLITSLSGQQQALRQSLEDEDLEAASVGHSLMRGKKRAVGKSKVLRIAVVEPPMTARERQRRQQAMDTGRRRMTFNATHAAVSNFTSALLNSELALRAPSSSPVDMFFRSLYQNHHLAEPMTSELWNMQKADGSIQAPPNGISQGRPKRLDHIHTDEGGDHVTAPINHSDGLVAPAPSEQENLQQLTSLYNKISKAPVAPKVKDLMDLQRLYKVMKKHGDAYANGGAGYYFSQSPVNQADVPGKNALERRHTDRRNLHKQPYYYYPYQGGAGRGSHGQSGQGDAPLYVVTGAQSLAMQRRGQGRGKQVEADAPLVRHRLLRFQEPGEGATTWVPQKTKNPKHEITVMMPKTPGITQLEQIQEHVLH